MDKILVWQAKRFSLDKTLIMKIVFYEILMPDGEIIVKAYNILVR